MKEEKVDSDSTQEKASIGKSIWIVLGLIIIMWGGYWKWIAPIRVENQFDPLQCTLFWPCILGSHLRHSSSEI